MVDAKTTVVVALIGAGGVVAGSFIEHSASVICRLPLVDCKPETSELSESHKHNVDALKEIVLACQESLAQARKVIDSTQRNLTLISDQVWSTTDTLQFEPKTFDMKSMGASVVETASNSYQTLQMLDGELEVVVKKIDAYEVFPGSLLQKGE
jgi:hypothetical protein